MGVYQYQNQLDQPGAGRCQGGPGDPHGRQTQQSENKQGVERDVGEQRNEKHHRRDHHPLDAAHDVQIHHSHGGKEVRGRDDPQIHRPLGDHGLVVREQPHNQRGSRLHRRKKDRRDDQRKAKRDPRDFFDGAGVALAPVLGRQHRRPRGQSEKDQGHDELDLPGQRGAGQDLGADLAQHDDVGGCDRDVDEILQCHGQHEGCDHAGKRPAARVLTIHDAAFLPFESWTAF